MNEFEHLIIQLAEIKLATRNFSNNVIIGSGGFGKVYVGEVSHSKGQSMVAIKRLDRKFGQGDSEFWKEIMMLSRYTHKNLISLLGFCDEDGEKILVYEHASNGSLDRHLGSTSLTWAQRIKICLDAAKGIRYLHDHKGTQQRVLHRDIKSANILLDHNWNAKVSDMGLSKLGPANQLHTNFYTNVVGTPGYCDPQYMITYMLTKESDVYSFGVVLFEVLSGRLCYEVDSNHQLHILVPRWKTSYILKKLHEIIFKDLIPPMNKTSLETIANTAFQCVQESREQRPKISLVVKKLENALKLQERYEMNLRKEYHNKEIIKVVETSSNYTYLKDLISKSKKVLLSLGTTVKEGTKQKDVEDGGGGGSGATTARKGKALLHGLEGNMPKFVRFEGIMSFTAVDLLRAMGMIIGKNSYGTVYKVELKDGELAVRRLRETSTKDQRVFKTKANVIGKIRHPNLLAMRAYYIGPEGQKLLVFDYMPKGNLAAFLHARGPETPVDWQTRMRIAKGIARGLFALHTYHKILHGNLTTNNVLLDKNINPKIADFGLSSLMTAAANSQVRARTGALGYRAPELSNYKKANTKTDVYSLGVIMLELLTGKQPGESMNGVDLPQWVASVVKKERTNEVFDLELMKDASAIGMGDELLNTLKLALRCADPSPSARPEVQQVLDQLEKKGSITGPRSSAVGKRHEFQL